MTKPIPFNERRVAGFVSERLRLGSQRNADRRDTHTDHNEKEEREAALAQLSAEDRPLAEVQGYCAVAGKPLGSMGPPIKLIVNEQPVFLCCKGCENKAKSNPDKTLAKVDELKTRVKSQRHN